MANQEHVELLKQGSTVWNAWRGKHSEAQLDLVGANLSELDLSNANLTDVDLRRADLSLADLRNADLSNANLGHAYLLAADLTDANLNSARVYNADLSYTHLNGANLIRAKSGEIDLSNANLPQANLLQADLSFAKLRHIDLTDADLHNADLSNANLTDANLTNTNLTNANLTDANLTNANLINTVFLATHLGQTLFAQVDLCNVQALDTAIHHGPSYVDVKTVQLPEGETRIHFLRGVGFSDTFIDYLPSLSTAAIQYASCFISYAHQDETLARRLYKDLQDKGVRCWFALHDLRPGTLLHRGIENAIHVHETVLLLLSEHAVASNWVAHEVETTLNRQARERRDLLFPLRLDESVMLAKDDWAARLRESRHIGDFTNWQNDAIYQQRFADLLRHLKVKMI